MTASPPSARLGAWAQVPSIAPPYYAYRTHVALNPASGSKMSARWEAARHHTHGGGGHGAADPWWQNKYMVNLAEDPALWGDDFDPEWELEGARFLLEVLPLNGGVGAAHWGFYSPADARTAIGYEAAYLARYAGIAKVHGWRRPPGAAQRAMVRGMVA